MHPTKPFQKSKIPAKCGQGGSATAKLAAGKAPGAPAPEPREPEPPAAGNGKQDKWLCLPMTAACPGHDVGSHMCALAARVQCVREHGRGF